MLKECVKVVNGGSLDIDHRVTNPLGVVVERGSVKWIHPFRTTAVAEKAEEQQLVFAGEPP